MAALGDVGTEGTQIRGQQLLLCGPQRDYRGIAEWRLRQEAQKAAETSEQTEGGKA